MNLFDDNETFEEDVDIIFKKSKTTHVYSPLDDFVKLYLFLKSTLSISDLEDIYKKTIESINSDPSSTAYDKKVFVKMPPDKLRNFMLRAIKYFGPNGNYNWIDTSCMTSFMDLFNGSEFRNFNGDISRWDTSGITNMLGTFKECASFKGDISCWDVSSVKFINNNTTAHASQELKDQIKEMKKCKRFTSRNPKMLW